MYVSCIKPNITYDQLKAISIFQKTKPFKIIDCDKNVGLALISNELYENNIFTGFWYCQFKSKYENTNRLYEVNVSNDFNELEFSTFISKIIESEIKGLLKYRNLLII